LKQSWTIRIVGTGTEPASQLLANPQNWRIHPKPQQKAMQGALNELGWIQTVLVNKTTGNMIDGHLRVALALHQGEDTPVPVTYIELSEAEESLALATLDPLSAMASADKEVLDELLRQATTDNVALQEMMTNLAKDNLLMPEFKEYDESIADEVEMTTCPSCGHVFLK